MFPVGIGRPSAAGHSPGTIAFTVADVLWVVARAFVVLLFWADLAALARFLVIAVALVVEVFATLQFRAAGGIHGTAPRLA
jgi:hypothetical protein